MNLIKRFIRNQFRKKSRVYIIPTSMGGYFIGLILLIFLLGVGYSNNLLIGLGLFLSTLGMFWLVEAHFWMDNFKFENIRFSDSEAGTPLIIKLEGDHPQKSLFMEKLLASVEVSDDQILELGQSDHLFHARPMKRGLYQAEYIKLGSEGFLGLFYSWRFFRIDQSFWVYPQRQFIPSHRYLQENQIENTLTVVRSQGRDFHRQYVDGDDAKRIDWKRWAKNEELYVFVGEEKRGLDDLLIQINKSSPTIETDLSQASFLIHQLFQENRPWRLAIDNEIHGPDSSELHFVKSLRRLAEC